jgi:hypothetical protein
MLPDTAAAVEPGNRICIANILRGGSWRFTVAFATWQSVVQNFMIEAEPNGTTSE